MGYLHMLDKVSCYSCSMYITGRPTSLALASLKELRIWYDIQRFSIGER